MIDNAVRRMLAKRELVMRRQRRGKVGAITRLQWVCRRQQRRSAYITRLMSAPKMPTFDSNQCLLTYDHLYLRLYKSLLCSFQSRTRP